MTIIRSLGSVFASYETLVETLQSSQPLPLNDVGTTRLLTQV